MKKNKQPKDPHAGKYFISISKLCTDQSAVAFGRHPMERLNMFILLFLHETEGFTRLTLNPQSLKPDVFVNIERKFDYIVKKHHERSSHENELETMGRNFVDYIRIFNRPLVSDTSSALSEWPDDIFRVVRDLHIYKDKFYVIEFFKMLGHIRNLILCKELKVVDVQALFQEKLKKAQAGF